MSEGRVVFPNAPIELVAAEVRFPQSARLRQPETLDALQLALEDILPIRRAEQAMTADAPSTGEVMRQQHEQVTLLIDRRSTISAAIRPTALNVETTHYGEFDEFRDVVRRCTVALAEQRAVPGVDRVGLRYVDEIRVPEPIEDAGSWERWVSGDLLAARSLGGSNRPSMLQGTMRFETGEHTSLTVSYAMLTGRGVVQPVSLRPRDTSSGPFFVLDIDSYWEPPSDQLDEFDPERIVALLDKLHPPVVETFERGARRGTMTDGLHNKSTEQR